MSLVSSVWNASSAFRELHELDTFEGHSSVSLENASHFGFSSQLDSGNTSLRKYHKNYTFSPLLNPIKWHMVLINPIFDGNFDLD
jgi:hypothetical protein